MLTGPLPARPARAVADAPVDLLPNPESLAKGWLLTLIAQQPLEAASRLPLAELAHEAPGLCAAMAAALPADPALDRLRAGGDLCETAARVVVLAGGEGPAGAVGALAALRATFWAELTAVLMRPDPELVSALAARLALVCDIVTAAALESPPAARIVEEAPATPGPSPDELAVERRPPAGPSPEEPAVERRPTPESGAAEPAAGSPRAEPLAPERPGPEPIVPERRSAPQPAGPPAASGASEAREAATPARLADTPRLVAVPDLRLTGPPAPVEPASGEPEIGEWREPWAAAVARRLDQTLAAGIGCGLLAVEIEDIERLLAGDIGGEARTALDRAERAMRDELRPGDGAVREHEGRLWVIAPGIGVEGARSLARRLVAAAAAAAAPHGAPLRAAAGVAVSPDDGVDPRALLAHADEGVFAARAAGVPFA